jgi:hypothetical protein
MNAVVNMQASAQARLNQSIGEEELNVAEVDRKFEWLDGK